MEFKNVYFLGIGGIGMSALARYFLHEGKKVGHPQRVDHQYLHTAQFLCFGILDGFKIRQVSQRPDAEARDFEALGMVARNGYDLHLPHPERLRGVDLV